ncbi:hypothetical protein ISCGN_018464 [Ixodes scapularis]
MLAKQAAYLKQEGTNVSARAYANFQVEIFSAVTRSGQTIPSAASPSMREEHRCKITIIFTLSAVSERLLPEATQYRIQQSRAAVTSALREKPAVPDGATLPAGNGRRPTWISRRCADIQRIL